MVKKRSSLLDEFLTERISVLTNVNQTVQLEDNQVADVPLILTGILVDYDEEFLLIAQEDSVESLPELISRAQVISVRIEVDNVTLVADPNTPQKKDMN